MRIIKVFFYFLRKLNRVFQHFSTYILYPLTYSIWKYKVQSKVQSTRESTYMYFRMYFVPSFYFP